MKRSAIRVTVIDMQPITPAVGGGRQRLLGLYHALGPNIECTYVGSYDWPGEPFRDQQLTRGLREIVVPLSDAHHQAAKALSDLLDGRTVIDIAFPDQVALSPEFLRIAREQITGADIVVFSHPWCFPPLADALRSEQLVVYDSHNVEALLRVGLLGETNDAKQALAELVVHTELALVSRADLVLACSEDDVALYQRLFDADPIKFRIAPNGAFVDRFPQPSAVGRHLARHRLGLPESNPIAIFLGSSYGPNTEAVQFIVQKLASVCPYVLFVIAGGVGEHLVAAALPVNVIATGRVDDGRRDELLVAADLALNPMSAGSGTNIKMFDYMAAGLPVLTTEVGARGICNDLTAPAGVFVKPLDEFQAHCGRLASTVFADERLRRSARDFVRQRFSWERISGELGRLFISAAFRHRSRREIRQRVALMSTWNVVCGIGEHSAYLADALSIDGDADVLVLGNDLRNHQPIGFERDLHGAVARVWHWDNVCWHSSIDEVHLRDVLRLSHPDMLLIEHHTAYAPFEALLRVVQCAVAFGIRVVIEMHNGRDVPDEHKRAFCEAGAILISHHVDELTGIPQSRTILPNVRVMPLPILDPIRSSRTRGSGAPPVIGGFGFLRPYKGLATLVEVVSLLKPKYPHVRYRGLHATYPGDSSQDYLRECLALANELGVAGNLDIDTRFLPIDTVDEELLNMDVVVLPYMASSEGASSAVNQALRSGHPVIVSPSEIFKSVSDAVFTVARHEPEEYARAIDRVLTEPALSEGLIRRSAAWVEQHSYARAAAELLDLGWKRHAQSEAKYACR